MTRWPTRAENVWRKESPRLKFSSRIPAAPEVVTVGFRLILAASAIWLVVIVFRVVLQNRSSEMAAVAAAARERGLPSSGPTALAIAWIAFITLVGIVLYVVLPTTSAFRVRNGRRGARIVLAAPTLLMLAAVPGGNFFDYLPTTLMVSGTVLLFLPPSTAFLRRSRARRDGV